jgi:phage terminase large subunit-like protein
MRTILHMENSMRKDPRDLVYSSFVHFAENDLSAHLIAKGFECIAFPLEAPQTRTYRWTEKTVQTWTREKGHVLMENYSKEQLKAARETKVPDPHYFYQQGQGRIKSVQIRETDFKLCDKRNSQGPFVISIDAAQSDTGSYNVAQVWDVGAEPWHLRTQFREQCGFHEFAMATKKLITRWRPGAILVENAANGPALIDTLRQKLPSANFIPIDPNGSKGARLERHRKAIVAGLISIQETERWVDSYVLEFVHHPNRESDQVDATTQLLDWQPEKHKIVAAESFFARPAGVYGSTGRPIRAHGLSFSSRVPGIVRAIRRR